MSSRYDQMAKQCNEFDAAHPEVWRMFVKLTLDRIDKGFAHYSADAIFHRIRWEMALPIYELGKEFKLNDNYTAFYARAFMRMYPKHDGFFRTRKQISKRNGASPFPQLTPQFFDER